MKSKLLIMTALLTGLFSCTKEIHTQEVIDKAAPAQTSINVDPNLPANKLVEIGEQLISPYTFMLADKAFDFALQNDPQNFKAQFYKSLLKRFMVLKGIMGRLRSFNDLSAKNYNTTKKDMPESALKDFLLNAEADLHSSLDIQNLISDYQKSVNDFRVFAKNNEDQNFVFNLNPDIFKDRIKENLMYSCTSTNTPEGGFIVNCNYTKITQVQLNMADIKALQQEAAGEVLYLSIYTTWDLPQVDQIDAFINSPAHHTNEENAKFMESIPGFGKLRKSQLLSTIKEIGSDFSAAARYAIDRQRELCQYNYQVPANRPNFLFNRGICAIPSSERDLAQLNRMLSGITTVDVHTEHGDNSHNKNITVNAFAWSNLNANLTDFFPTHYSECDKPAVWKDATFGGVFPTGDGNQLIESCGK